MKGLWAGSPNTKYTPPTHPAPPIWWHPANQLEIVMGNMFNQLFKALQVLFEAMTSTANTLNNVAKWAEEGSAIFVDEARTNRAKAAIAGKKELLAME